jgi:glycine hydroxymethyltransferase
MVTSGIRVGTPALTTRGMKEAEMILIARLIGEVLTHRHDEAKIRAIREEVRTLCDKFPLYPERIARG